MTTAGKLNADARRKTAAAFLQTTVWKRFTMRGGAAVAANADVSRISMRVFAKGCPRGCLREVIQLLAEGTPFTDPMIDSNVEPGEWHHKAAWWVRDAQASGGPDATVTLFREISDGPVTQVNVLEDGCGSVTTIRYVFDAPAVESPPSPSPQGHAVRISGVQRDPETSLFSYYVTDTESKTKTLGELKTADDRFSESFEHDWTGLRGTPDDPQSSEGGAVAVPAPGAAGGVTTEVSFQRDLSDCSLAARARKRKAKKDVLAADSSSKTVYEETSQTEVSAASAPLAAAPAPADGRIERHGNRHRPDGLTDTTLGVQQELEVENAEVSSSDTVYKSGSRVAHKSLTAAKAAALPAASAAGGVVTAVQKSRTPGDRTDASVSVETEKKVDNARVAESRTIFETETAATHRGQTEAPAAAAGGGAVKSVVKELSEGGLLTVQVSDRTEIHVPEAEVSEAKTFYNEERSETAANVPAAAAAEVAPASAADGVIRRVTRFKTPGGSVRVGVSRQTELPVYAGQQVQKSPLAIRTTDTWKSLENPAALLAGEYGSQEHVRTPGARLDTAKTVVVDQIGAIASTAYESHFLGSSVVTDSVVAAPGTNGLGLSGRVITSLRYTRAEGQGWRETRTVETAPAAYMETLIDQITSNPGAGDDNIFPPGTVAHEKVIMFIASALATVRDEVNSFMRLYNRTLTLRRGDTFNYTVLYFSFEKDISFGLRPDRFGLWNGTLAMKATMVNKLQATLSGT